MGDLLNRYLSRQEPWDEEFNIAVMAMARKALPMGWDIVPLPLAPTSLPDLNSALKERAALPVFADEPGIFGCIEHAAAFRAWQMATHYAQQNKMSLGGQAASAYSMCWQLFEEYGGDAQVIRWCSWVLAMTVGRAYYRLINGEDAPSLRFPGSDGVRVTHYQALARRLNIEHAAGMTQVTAIREARKAWGN